MSSHAERTGEANSPDCEQNDALDLDLRSAPLHAHVVREGEQVVEVLVRQLQHFEDLVAAQSFTAVEHLFAGHREDVGGGEGLGHGGSPEVAGEDKLEHRSLERRSG